MYDIVFVNVCEACLSHLPGTQQGSLITILQGRFSDLPGTPPMQRRLSLRDFVYIQRQIAKLGDMTHSQLPTNTYANDKYARSNLREIRQWTADDRRVEEGRWIAVALRTPNCRWVRMEAREGSRSSQSTVETTTPIPNRG
jgi:hypothetical protein